MSFTISTILLSIFCTNRLIPICSPADTISASRPHERPLSAFLFSQHAASGLAGILAPPGINGWDNGQVPLSRGSSEDSPARADASCFPSSYPLLHRPTED